VAELTRAVLPVTDRITHAGMKGSRYASGTKGGHNLHCAAAPVFTYLWADTNLQITYVERPIRTSPLGTLQNLAGQAGSAITVSVTIIDDIERWITV